MAFVNIGLPGGPFDGASGMSWDTDQTNYTVLDANWNDVGVINLTKIRITMANREIGNDGRIIVENNGDNSFVLENETGSLVTEFIFPNPVSWEGISLSIEIGLNYIANTLILLEGDGIGPLFGASALWTNYRNTTEEST